MKHQEVATATEKIVISIATQAQALFPSVTPTTIRNEAEAWVHRALGEARRLHPRDLSLQLAHAQERADYAIRMNLIQFRGTMH